MDSSLKDFLDYYNGYIKQKGFEPSAYDVNFWVVNFFTSKKKRNSSSKKEKELKNDRK
jgi:hypothetical protein